MKNSLPKVGIVILNWNAYDLTINCIESLKSLDYTNKMVIVVDNASSDNSYEILKGKYTNLKIVLNSYNMGYAGGVNAGIREALKNKCEYVWLLNNDAKILNSTALSELVSVCESDLEIGVAGSLIKYPTGEIQFSGGEIALPLVKGIHSIENISKAIETEYVTGCSMLIPKRVIERIGLIEEDYFLYYEDSDYCFKAKQEGLKRVVVPQSLIEHELGGTSRKNPSINYIYYNLRNRFLFSYKWLSKNEFLLFFVVVSAETALRAVRYIGLRRWNSLNYLIKAYIDGIRKKEGSVRKS